MTVNTPQSEKKRKKYYFTLPSPSYIIKERPGERKENLCSTSPRGAEKSDIVGLYLLMRLQHLGIKAGLFRDVGLAVTRRTKRENEKVKQEISKIFKEEGLDVTIIVNLKVVEFLDVELDLSTGTHKPYTNPNHTIL